MKPKRWQLLLLSLVLLVSILPIPQFGAGVARATGLEGYSVGQTLTITAGSPQEEVGATSIQPSGDNWLDKDNPTTNNGASAAIATYTLTGTPYCVGLLEFNLSSIPAGATVTSATLSLYYYAYYSTYNPTGNTITLVRQRRADWSASQSTWNIFKTSNNWGMAGTSNTSTDIDTTFSQLKALLTKEITRGAVEKRPEITIK